jgi:glutathione S-transferase
MGLKLFYVPMTRAGRARWMLEEVGVPYEIEKIDVKAGTNRTPEYLSRVHPLGHVPALHDSDGDVTMFESAAICMYLADKFPEKQLAPPVGSPARAHYYQWMVFSMAELEPPVAAISRLVKPPEAERDSKALAEARAKLAAAAGVIKQNLAQGREYMLGAEFSAVDVMIAGVLGWAKVLRELEDQPELLAYVRRCTSRPASQRSRAD